MIGGLEATVMRIQLAIPHNHFVSPQLFNQFFTMHGTTMVFLVGMPMLFGFAELSCSADDWRARHGLSAPQRLQLLDELRFGGIILTSASSAAADSTEQAVLPTSAWFAYAPLTSQAFSAGHSTDYWIIGLLVSGFGSIGTALNIVTTVFCMRCPGMTLGRMPLFAWLNLVTSLDGADRDLAPDSGTDHVAHRPLSRRPFL